MLLFVCVAASAQRGGRGGPPPTPKAAAPVDITGYWVSQITEDWRYRQFTAPKGDFTSVPLNQAGKDAANAWDPAKDEAAGQQCKAYGAPGVMRLPTRLHITWQDDNTLKLETDAGMQTRALHFGATQAGAAQGPGSDWQGVSAASWDTSRAPVGTGFGGIDFGFEFPPPPGGSLKVVTTKLKPGYLRKNGVPYGAGTELTEYFERFDVPGGDSLLLVISEVTDPQYLRFPFWTSTHYKKQNDAAGWNPTLCAAK